MPVDEAQKPASPQDHGSREQGTSEKHHRLQQQNDEGRQERQQELRLQQQEKHFPQIGRPEQAQAQEPMQEPTQGSSPTAEATVYNVNGTRPGGGEELPSEGGTNHTAMAPADMSNIFIEPDPALAGLQVDEDEMDDPGYAESHYPTVAARYRVENIYDSNTINSSSRSLYPEELDYVIENGRRYCGHYTFPNDELEQDRLRVEHQVFLHVFNLQLTSVPLENPTHILDIGTGTGEWAISMGEVFPNCEVVGVDISAIQPTAVPHNVFFEIDDCELEWMRPENSIDLVHLRNMAGAFSDWSFIYRQAFSCLKPGGYIEVLDFHNHSSSSRNFYDSFSPDSELHMVARELEEAGIRSGRRGGIQHLDPALLRDVGYVDLDVKEHFIPVNPLESSAGKLWLIACLHGIEAGSLRLLTKYMGWPAERVMAMCERLREEFRAKALNPETAKDFRMNLRVVTARKPYAPAPWTSLVVPTQNGHAGEASGEDDSTIGS